MSKLDGKVAVVSGGTSGIGLAIAKRFVEEGAHVFIFGRRQEMLDEAKALIGEGVTTIQADGAELDDLDRIAAQVKFEKGVVDIVVSNAAVIEQVPLEAITPEHFDKTFGLNTRGALFMVQKLLPLMTNGGSVILVASAAHYMGLPNHSTYSASKAAVRSFARTWAAEFKGNGIRVNALSPGVVDTPILDGQADTEEGRAAIREAYASFTPIGRLGNPPELASAAVFLASSESSFMTGSDMVVDGGISNV